MSVRFHFFLFGHIAAKWLIKMKHDVQTRILLLLKLLYEQSDETHTLTATGIIQYWAIHGIAGDRRNVYSDITLLTDLGVDIVQRRERQNRYFLGSRLFELPELKLLVDAVESSRFITWKKSDALIEKLAQLTSRNHGAELHRPIYMGSAVKPSNETIYYAIDTLHTAIREKQQVRFQYIDYTPQKEKILKHDGQWYEFSPYALIWSRDYYYAVGYSQRHNGLAQFRVDRIANAELTPLPAIPTPNFDPTLWKNAPDSRILKSDVTVAKNYPDEKQIRQLERTVPGYFDYIEDLIERENTFTMEEFAASINEFLAFRKYDILEGKGRVTKKMAAAKAAEEYTTFNKTQEITSDFDREIRRMLEQGGKP